MSETGPKIKFAAASFFALASFAFCNPASSEPDVAPFPYALSNARVVTLPQTLDEISGIIYNPTAKALQAVQDEEGSLYTIEMKDKPAVHAVSFGGPGDYEDLVLVNGQAYVLESNGAITSFAITDPGKAQHFSFPQLKKNDFETLLYLPGTSKLLLVCKSCKGGKKNTAAWEFDLQTGEYTASEFTFTMQNAVGLSGKKGVQPSAVAVHPKTGEYYFLSSANALLVVTDKNGVVKTTQPLDPRLYPQPEGICFLPGGELVISNEKGNGNTATLLIATPLK